MFGNQTRAFETLLDMYPALTHPKREGDPPMSFQAILESLKSADLAIRGVAKAYSDMTDDEKNVAKAGGAAAVQQALAQYNSRKEAAGETPVATEEVVGGEEVTEVIVQEAVISEESVDLTAVGVEAGEEDVEAAKVEGSSEESTEGETPTEG